MNETKKYVPLPQDKPPICSSVDCENLGSPLGLFEGTYFELYSCKEHMKYYQLLKKYFVASLASQIAGDSVGSLAGLINESLSEETRANLEKAFKDNSTILKDWKDATDYLKENGTPEIINLVLSGQAQLAHNFIKYSTLRKLFELGD